MLSIELLVQLAQLIELLLFIEVTKAKLLLENSDEPVILFQECIPVSEISHSETDSESFAGVSGTNTAFCCAENLACSFLLSSSLLSSIGLDLDLRDDMRSV